MQQNANHASRLNHQAAIKFITVVAVMFCGVLLTASLHNLLEGLPFWSSYNPTIAPMFRISQ
jgi:hypothetical protein